MLLFVTILLILGIYLIGSIIAIVLLYKAGVRQLETNEVLQENNKILEENNNLFEGWISEFKVDVMKTFNHIKSIDDKQMFEKDDDVGVVFQDMLDIIRKLNERTQGIEEKE